MKATSARHHGNILVAWNINDDTIRPIKCTESMISTIKCLVFPNVHITGKAKKSDDVDPP